MTDKERGRPRLVVSDGKVSQAKPSQEADDFTTAASRDLDWTILMARAQDGDNAAYLRLLQEITPYLRTLARRWHKASWDIEDTVQDILLTLHSIRHTYDPARPFGPWLAGIANRRAIDRLRRQGRQSLREAPLSEEHEANFATAETQENDLDQARLSEALGGLPPVQRKAVDLLKIKEMSLKEASEASGLSISALKVATHRALRTLRIMLSDRRDS